MSTVEEMKKHLCHAIWAVQVDSGQQAPELTDQSLPLSTLPGFDSLAAIDVAVRLSAMIGIEFESIPLFDESGERPLCIAEIAELLVHKQANQVVSRPDSMVARAVASPIAGASLLETGVKG